MLLKDKLKDYQLILGSQSPRRKVLLEELGLKFNIVSLKIDESYPKDIEIKEVPKFLAKKKAAPFLKNLQNKQIVLTSDTVVILENELIGKPKNNKAAKKLLQKFSGKTHEVITAVFVATPQLQKVVSVSSKVSFKALTKEEIDYYVENFQPLYKAGAYGIQEWIGYIGIERIEGSYSNIVGLPTATVYQLLSEVIN